MKRILFLEQYGSMGGGQSVLLSLVSAALDMQAAVTVVAPGGGALQAALHRRFDANVTFVDCPEPKLTHGRKSLRDVWSAVVYGWRFRRYLGLLQQQQVIYINGMRHLPHMLFFAQFLGGRIICHLHLDHTAPEKALLRLATSGRRPFRVVANSRYVAERSGLKSQHVCLVQNALDPAFANLGFQNRFRIPARQWQAAVIGTVRPEKGQDVAIAAVAPRNDMVLHVIGRDGDGAGVWIEALKSSASPHILFENATPDLPRAICALGIQFSLVPSRWNEPFGLVAIESMASSCITIVSGRGGLAEIAEHTGALVAQDAAAIAMLLDQLCAMSPDSLETLARDQYEATQASYGPARFARGMQSVLAAAFQPTA